MASATRTLFYDVSHFLLLLLFLIFIRGSRSCPPSIPFQCPDIGYEELPPPFTNSTLDGDDCGRPCELTCQNNSLTMINCTGSPVPRCHVSDIDPITGTIVVEYPDWAVPDDLKNDTCKAYSALNTFFHSIFSDVPSPFRRFQLVSVTILGEHEIETFLGCPYPNGDDHSWDPKHNRTCGNDDDEAAIVYGPYDYDYEHSQPPPAGCIQFPNLSPKPKGRKETIILCSVLLSGLTIIVLIVLIVCWRRRKNKSGSTTLPSRIMSLSYTRSDLEEGSMNNGVNVFSYAELQEITNNFDPARELGEGGFGVVYHGKLNDGREVAVKRMFEKNYKQIEQFKNEIRILTNVRHQNLVTLYGSSSRNSRELLLVYEYIPNGTVADHLHGDQSKSVLLLWPTRMKIAIETATALSYLHFNGIIHRDIKTYNILLDRNFCAKVADFGLSRLFPADVTHVSTAPQGTPGYLDPEYHQCYHLTDKSDVYSFGVVLIELISSMPAIDMGRHRHEVNLSNYAMNRIQCSAFDELVDPNLGFEKNFKVRRMITLVAELAFQCLQHEREVRPSMEEVVEALKRIESVDYDELEAGEMGQ